MHGTFWVHDILDFALKFCTLDIIKSTPQRSLLTLCDDIVDVSILDLGDVADHREDGEGCKEAGEAVDGADCQGVPEKWILIKWWTYISIINQ